jgi:TRAP-type mannitol/chloroaromatic compound transport system permease large subunit
VIPLAWGENGFRQLTNGKRPLRTPEDLTALQIRVVGYANIAKFPLLAIPFFILAGYVMDRVGLSRGLSPSST